MALEAFRCVDPSFKISFARESGNVPVRIEKTIPQVVPELHTYLRDALAPSSPENAAQLDPLTHDILLATWGGMLDDEIATELGPEVDSLFVAATRVDGYLALGVTHDGSESHLEAVQSAIDTGSVDLSLLLDQETIQQRVNKYPTLPRQEINEALRYINGEDITMLPRTEPLRQDISQRKQLLLSAFNDLGETRGEMAFTYTIAERALKEQLKTRPAANYADLTPAA